MVIRKPAIKMVEDKEGNKTPVIQKFDKKYDEEDLILDFMLNADDDEDESEVETEVEDTDEEVPSNDDNDWLNNL